MRGPRLNLARRRPCQWPRPALRVVDGHRAALRLLGSGARAEDEMGARREGVRRGGGGGGAEAGGGDAHTAGEDCLDTRRREELSGGRLVCSHGLEESLDLCSLLLELACEVITLRSEGPHLREGVGEGPEENQKGIRRSREGSEEGIQRGSEGIRRDRKGSEGI